LYLASTVVKFTGLADTETTAAKDETFLNVDMTIAIDHSRNLWFRGSRHDDLSEFSHICASFDSVHEHIKKEFRISWTGC